ncbi:hypothetical protein EJB05_52481, partial [Eragrostis curvula]
MPPSRRGSGRQRAARARRREKAAAERDWADGLPMDALLAILGRLGHIDVLMSAELVCRSWRRAARDEPSLWRRITMRGHEEIAGKLNRCGMACEAVRRSAGRCEAFCGEYAGDDGFLIYLSEQAPCLKSLRLISCKGVTGEGLVEAAKELPLLEELEVALCNNIGNSSVYEVVGQVCPQLKHFGLRKPLSWRREVYDDIQWIANMRGLRSLQLFDNPLTSAGLEIILDNCLKLESLDIRHCFNVEMNETLLAKFSGIRTLRLPEDPTDDCDFQVASPVMRWFVEPAWSPPWSPNLMPNWSPNLRNESDDDDSGEFDFYREPSRYEEDLDKYDKVLPFSMRTFLK